MFPTSRATVLAAMMVIAIGSSTCPGEDAATKRDAYLESCAAGYSDEHQMLGMPFRSPGYHSQVPQGTWVHPTRQSLAYAVALVDRGGPEDLTRAEKILRKILTLQVTDPDHAYYGIWPWLLEEPVDKMAPPDRNWADFLGAQLAVLLKDYPKGLPGDLVEAMRTSLHHASVEIRQRNVQPNYTNIAIMGGGVCAAAGELLGDQEMLAYGRDRLQRCVADAEYHGSFNEFNSPTYTMVALAEAERVLQLVQDEAARTAAEQLRRTAWQIIADSFHPATGQWAGPHSRAYSDLVSASLAEYLEEQTGAKIPAGDSGDGRPATYEVLRHLPCPEELRARFAALPCDPLEIRRTFVRKENESDSIRGTTWHTADACLGSVNRSTMWTQCRTLIGYWHTQDEPVVVLRQRFLHDGEDFTSMGVRNDQQGPRVLSLFGPLRNHGSWHPTLDRPKDGVFQAKDFRVRYQLAARNATATRLNDHTFELAAGQRRVIVHVVPGRFDGQEVAWECGTKDGLAVVDGVCYRGEPKGFDFKTLDDVRLAIAVELLGENESPATGPTWCQGETGGNGAEWCLGEQTLRVAW